MERARINGVELAYELRGRGAPIVMVHGAQGDQSMFAGLAAAFAEKYRVLTFDQRGSGLSEKPDVPYGMAINKANPDFVRFVNGVLTQLERNGTWQRLYAKWLPPAQFGPIQSPPTAQYDG